MSDCFKPKPEDYWKRYCGPEGAISQPRTAATPKTKECQKPKREQKPEQKKRRSFIPGVNFGDERSHDDHRKRAQQQDQERQRQQEQERERQRQREAEAQRQKEAEAERQRQAEAQRQRDEAKAKQAEAERQRQAESQRQQERQRNRSFLPGVNLGDEKSYTPRQQEQQRPQQQPQQQEQPQQKRRSLPGVNFGPELPHTAKPVRLPEFVPTSNEVEAPAPTPRSNAQPPIALPTPEPAPKPRVENRRPISIPVELPEPINPSAEKPRQERQEPKPKRVTEPIDWSSAIDGLGSFFSNRPSAPTIDVSQDLEDIAALEEHYRKQPVMTEIPLPNNFRAAKPRGEVVSLPSVPKMALPQIKVPLPSIEIPEKVPVENKSAQPLQLKMEDRQ